MIKTQQRVVGIIVLALTLCIVFITTLIIGKSIINHKYEQIPEPKIIEIKDKGYLGDTGVSVQVVTIDSCAYVVAYSNYGLSIIKK